MRSAYDSRMASDLAGSNSRITQVFFRADSRVFAERAWFRLVSIARRKQAEYFDLVNSISQKKHCCSYEN